MTRIIAKGSPFEERHLGVLERIVGSGTFAHIGAGFGDASLYFGARGWTGYCIEEDPDMFSILLRNVGQDGVKDRLTARLWAIEDMRCATMNPKGAQHDDNELSAATDCSITFDSLGLEPDLVKIDLNGRELDVLAGMDATLRQARPVVAISCESNRAGVETLLRGYGYRRLGAIGAKATTIVFISRRRHYVRSILVIPAVAIQYLKHQRFQRNLHVLVRIRHKIQTLPKIASQRLRGHAGFLSRLLTRRLSFLVTQQVRVEGERSRHLMRQRSSSRPNNCPEIVVAITSFPARISSAWIAIESILDQQWPADVLALCVSRDEFPNAVLPRNIRRYERFGLEVLWVQKNVRSYKKLAPARIRYPSASVVTADDDIIFPKTWLGDLCETSLDVPGAVVGHRGHEIAWIRGKLAPYNTWLPANRQTASGRLFLTGGAGCLYPPKLPSEHLLRDLRTPTRVCPTGDDIWYWAANRSFNIRQICLGGFHEVEHVRQLRSSPELQTVNVKGGANDAQLGSVLKHFGREKLFDGRDGEFNSGRID